MKFSLSATKPGRWLRAHNKAPFFVALMVFAATLAAYLYYWSNVRTNVQRDMHTAYNRQIRILGDSLSERLQVYETLLRGGAGLFVINDQITNDNWNRYFAPYEIEAKYPDIRGIGLSRYLTQDQLNFFLEERRKDGAPDYAIYPAGERSEYVPTVFAARYTGGANTGDGYDGYTDEIRREAMLRAADSGQPALSGRVTPVTEKKDNPAFIMYLPIYKPSLPLGTPAERRAALYGFSYASVDIDEMLSDLQSTSGNNFGVTFDDLAYLTRKPGALPAYESPAFDQIATKGDSIITTSKVNLYGREWQMTFAGSPDLISKAERQVPTQALLRGIFSSLLFAVIVWYLITYRERTINRWKLREVQTAKDDLLSLASHQLRTPATVVKQYVGMLLQGYGGKLTEQQMSMLGSAYESNERQLDIINQLLYVARLDAGRISLRKEWVDLPKLAREVVRDQKQTAEDRDQAITVTFPKKLYLEGDPRYLRMVLENLLSNAIKYTPESGTITITGKAVKQEVCIMVSDSGVGMDQKSIATIFDKFTRVENILSTDVNGSGVGLYLTREIVTLHGGRIDVTSKPGEGSTFSVCLPAGLEDESDE